MTAPNRHICLRFAQIKDVFLFATCEKLVVDLEGNIWYPETVHADYLKYDDADINFRD